MPAIADRYRRLADRFTETVAAVPSGAWGNQSPCADWDARDVVRHAVDTSAMFLGFIQLTLPDGAPSVDDDPHGAWVAARDTVQAALDDPAVAQQEFEGFFGNRPWENAVDQFLTNDALIHTWDLARATGLDERLDPEEVSNVRAALEPLGDNLRQPGVFGPALEPPPGADQQARLLAFLGRRAWP